MNDNVEIDGKISAGFTSYWNSDKHGNMSKIVSGTTDDDKGTEEMVTIPKEVDLDDLTELQEKVIRVAAKNPDQSTSDVAEKVGCSEAYPKNTLRENCGHWYENVFKERGHSNNTGRRKNSDATESEDTTDTSEDETTTSDQLRVKNACKVILATSENQELCNFAEWVLEQ